MTNFWQQALSDVITDPAELLGLLELDRALLPAAKAAAALFPLKVTQSYLARIQKANPRDPLLLQILPLDNELVSALGYVKDPLAEREKNPIPGLLHKYHDRVLLTLTSACAIHCRYCFRRHFPYRDNNPGRQGWHKIIEYLQANEHIHEVILSGGDPLSVSDALLTQFTDCLREVAHLKRLRIHTRLPIVLPLRVSEGLIGWIKQLPWPLTVVVHVNHPQEINDEVISAIRLLREAGVHVLNQSVLLANINDDVETLVSLSERLFESGILPYYLHIPDKVEGTAHFDLALARAKALHRAMSERLAGYLVPKLACEEPGKAAKTML